MGAFALGGYPQDFLYDLLAEIAILRDALRPILVLAEDKCEFHLCRKQGYLCLVPDSRK
jgi:hypothetical protein